MTQRTIQNFGENKKQRPDWKDPDQDFWRLKAAVEDEYLSKFDLKLKNIPMKYGFSPNTWREMTDVEILKKAGVWDIEKNTYNHSHALTLQC